MISINLIIQAMKENGLDPILVLLLLLDRTAEVATFALFIFVDEDA